MINYRDSEEGIPDNFPGKGENPFRAPEGYFENLPGEIMHKIESQPDFSKSPTVNPFAVPEGYFEKLPGTISDRINREKTGFFDWMTSMLRPRFVVPVALAMVIIAAGIIYYRSINNIDKSIPEFTVNDIENSEYIFAIDEELLVDALGSENETSNDQSFEEYLIDNNIDLTQIENRL